MSDQTGISEIKMDLQHENGMWPQIISQDEEDRAYEVLYSPGESRNLPPTHAQIERLSYELMNMDRRLRFFAVSHSPQPEDPNYRQYEILEKRFNDSPPEVVLIEGNIDFDYHVAREEALQKGEQYFISYLVQEHNKNLKSNEKPIEIKSGDATDQELRLAFKQVGYLDEEVSNFFATRGKIRNEKMYQDERIIRDTIIMKKVVKEFDDHKKVDMVFGSGHAIRERKAWEEFFR